MISTSDGRARRWAFLSVVVPMLFLLLSSSASAATIDSVGFSADPTEDEAVSVTITGSSEANRNLYAFWHSGSTACAATADAEYSHSNGSLPASAYSGDAIPAGSYSKTHSFTATAAGTYRICSYLAESPYVTPLATHSDTVDIRHPNGGTALSTPLPAYLSGDHYAGAATGSLEHDGAFAYLTITGDVACPTDPSSQAKRVAVPAGTFSSPVTADFGAEQARTFCQYLFVTGHSAPLAVVRDVARKQPLATPAAFIASVDPARKPTFTWASDNGSTDTLVLTEDDQELLRVSAAGAVTPTEADQAQLTTVDDYYDEQTPSTDQPSADPKLARIVRRGDGTSEVRMTSSLPPGRYGWQVIRARDAGEVATGPLQALRVIGPPLSQLGVKTRSRRGHSSAHPGYTTLSISTTPYAKVTLTLRRSNRVRVDHFSWGSKALESQRIDWNCNLRGAASYSYIVEAHDEQGKRLRRTGRFRVVSRAWCRSQQAKERRARARQRAAERQAALADARREAAAERARYARFLHNCEAAGGTPVKVFRSVGAQIMCRAPLGGFLIVPM
jgi:hypothetical protein